MRSLGRLKALQALEAAARHGSFVGASAELGVTAAAVGQLVRSLHRTSSDACMLFTLLHLLRMLLGRRVTGARWLAWVTGVALLGVLWFVGWIGYWLVWDQRAQQVAVGTARLVDALPIFADPFGRSLISDATVQPLLFFVILFVHMLLPLAMGASSFVMQRFSPQPADAMQAKMLLYFMPIFFTFIMLKLPAGLTLYILVNNLLSIAQQQYLMRRHAPPAAQTA